MIREVGTRFAEAVAGRPAPAADARGAEPDDAERVASQLPVEVGDADGREDHAMLWHAPDDTPPDAA